MTQSTLYNILYKIKVIFALVLVATIGNAKGVLDFSNGGALFGTFNAAAPLPNAIAILPGATAGNYFRVDIPGVADHIYFPQNGEQPPANVVRTLACANIQNNAVTNWYIEAFGGQAALQDAYAGGAIPAAMNLTPNGMGFLPNNGGPTQIITVNPAVAAVVPPIVAGAVNPLAVQPFSQQFWQTFRTIASNPVGRVLLYRLLIEIRRGGAAGNVENNVLVHNNFDLQQRNNCRSITINSGGNTYERINRRINFTLNNAVTLNTVSNVIVNNAREIIRHVRTSDIGLLHEMLHWFHSLRDYKKYLLDTQVGYQTTDFGTVIVPPLVNNGSYQNHDQYQIDIANFYYNNPHPIDGLADDERKRVSSRPWGTKYEEMRTILGYPIAGAHFKNGDDLSENLYRLSKQVQQERNMRFGHKKLTIQPNNVVAGHGYFEDNAVINNCSQSVYDLRNSYNIPPIQAFNFPGGTTTDPVNLNNQGLGDCKIK